MLRGFQRYVMPGLVFESVVVGGGYATGRELVEFFLSHGPLGGLLGLLATISVWGIVLAVTFEYARLTASYDYRTLFRSLLGRAWVVYELLYYAMLMLVLSVVGAACGAIFHQAFALPELAGSAVLIILVAVLVYFGSTLIERALSAWALALYVLYGGLVVWCFRHFHGSLAHSLTANSIGKGWIGGGVAYAGYNLAAAPAILFCLRHVRRRREAVTAGLLGGVFAVVPGMLLYLCVVAFYPAIMHEPVPTVFILRQIDSPVFSAIFQAALFVTLVKTGVGLLHALNERFAAVCASRGGQMPRYARPLASVAVLGFSLFLADRIGVVSLVARGYGTITYAFLAVYVLPMLTLGLWRVIKSNNRLIDQSAPARNTLTPDT